MLQQVVTGEKLSKKRKRFRAALRERLGATNAEFATGAPVSFTAIAAGGTSKLAGAGSAMSRNIGAESDISLQEKPEKSDEKKKRKRNRNRGADSDGKTKEMLPHERSRNKDGKDKDKDKRRLSLYE